MAICLTPNKLRSQVVATIRLAKTKAKVELEGKVSLTRNTACIAFSVLVGCLTPHITQHVQRLLTKRLLAGEICAKELGLESVTKRMDCFTHIVYSQMMPHPKWPTSDLAKLSLAQVVHVGDDHAIANFLSAAGPGSLRIRPWDAEPAEPTAIWKD